MHYDHIWKKTLGPTESVKYEFTVGKRYRKSLLITWCVIGGLFVLTIAGAPFGLFIMALAAFYYGFYLKTANAYAFTDNRVLVHRGWLSTKLITTEYQKITDVTVLEPFFSRVFFHSGSLAINTAGTSSEEIVLKNVENPYEIKKKLDELRGQH
ncbi:MAG: PH domain-containing protein [Minisyncoccota bacterium]